MGMASLRSATTNSSEHQKIVFRVSTAKDMQPRTGGGKEANMVLMVSFQRMQRFVIGRMYCAGTSVSEAPFFAKSNQSGSKLINSFLSSIKPGT